MTASIFVSIAILAAAPAVVPLDRAHAHNDYLHARPLLDALDQGFLSVEADIYLVDGKLLVAHERFLTAKDRTLEALYLDPLRERVKKNGGSVLPGAKRFTLLIDVKSDAESTYAALERVLEGYRDMLEVVRDGRVEPGPVTVVISGERPRATMAAEKVRHAFYDGRLADLESGEPASLILWISESWGARFKWTGEGPFPEEERKELRRIVERAHADGRRVRFWAIPSRPAFWKVLLDEGVDLINADDLQGLSEFLRGMRRF
jgi:hypothetical protein